MGEASHEEIAELRKQIETRDVSLGAKIDALAISVNLVHNILAEAKGANLPARFQALEEKVAKLKEVSDTRSEIPAQVEQNKLDIRTLFKFQYMAIGVLMFMQVAFTVLGKFALDALFKPSVTP